MPLCLPYPRLPLKPDLLRTVERVRFIPFEDPSQERFIDVPYWLMGLSCLNLTSKSVYALLKEAEGKIDKEVLIYALGKTESTIKSHIKILLQTGLIEKSLIRSSGPELHYHLARESFIIECIISGNLS